MLCLGSFAVIDRHVLSWFMPQYAASCWRFSLLGAVSLLLSACALEWDVAYSPQTILASQRLTMAMQRVGAQPDQNDVSALRQMLHVIDASYYQEVDLSALSTRVAKNIEKNQKDNESFSSKTQTQALRAHIQQQLVAGLDEHSSYFNAQEFAQFRQSLTGRFSGIGARITAHARGAILAPLPNSPARKAGLRKGDVVIRVGQEEISGQTIAAIAKKIRGVGGSSVTLTVIRNINSPQAEEIVVSVRRAMIQKDIAEARIIDNVGYVALQNFSPNSDGRLREIIQQWEAVPLVGYVIDLRYNPGGYLNQAVAVTDLFLAQGEIVAIVSRDDTVVYRARQDNEVTSRALVILVNAMTASSAEIVAEALSFHQQATVMGELTYAKGTVQSIIDLHEDGGMKLTTARYRSPSGRYMVTQGVVPDILVRPDQDSDEDALLEQALSLLHQAPL